MAPRVWLITGCSSGFGWEIAKNALSRGERVIATSRRVGALEGLKELGATTLALDVCQSDQVVGEVVAQANAVHGSIDVLVNNAGYILEGAVEACSAEEVEAQYAVNVFGTLRMIRTVLPYMRAQRSGIVCNMGSIAAWRGTLMGGLYCSTKASVAVLTESLKTEEESFGVDATIIEPGYFRTNFLTNNNRVTAAKKIPDLEPLATKQRAVFDQVSGKQPGDPVKGAQVIVDILTKSGPWAKFEKLPVRISLGRDAAQVIKDAQTEQRNEHEKFSALTKDTDADA